MRFYFLKKAIFWYTKRHMQSLYTKYRPKTLDEVLGQEHITKPLSQSIQEGNFSHSYIFHGTRGTGKTSIARIVANMLNVSQADLYEIDAASHTGVDTMRDLLESVMTLPMASPYKIYILDEVHMLSKSAFNALLKTLEEPPAHVIFILATTELEKVPDTIQSRSETYSFREPTEEILRDLVIDVSKKEEVTIDLDAVTIIAKLGRGSFRDTLSHLQKVLRSTDEKNITREHVEMVAGVPPLDTVFGWVRAILAGEQKQAQDFLEVMKKGQKDAAFFVEEALAIARAGLLIKVGARKADDFAGLGEYFVTEIASLATEQAETMNSVLVQKLLEAYGMVSVSPQPYLPLELIAISYAEKK